MIDFNDIPIFEDAEVRRKRVKAACEKRVKELVRYLYPKAIIGARDARVGSIDGEKGASLSIALTSDVPGQWIDHATGERGDVLTLWQRALGVDFASAIQEADKWAGGAPSQRAAIRHEAETAKPNPPETEHREVATYPYLSPAGDVLFEVVRFNEFHLDGSPVIKGDGKQAKIYKPRQPSGAFGYPPGLRPLYRLPEIERVREVVFCEGEKAADAIHQCGWVATSAPGGSSTKLDAIDWRPLAGKAVTLWPDNDEAGRKFMDKVAAQLASIGCTVRWVTLPADVPLKWDAADAGEEEIHALLNRSEPKRAAVKFITIADLAARKPPDWIVDQIIPEGAFSVLYGPSGSYKTFLALDMALSIACGLEWRGMAVRGTPVAYVAGEGVGGLYKRILPWMHVRGEGRTPDFHILDHSVQLTEAEHLDALVAGIEDLPVRPGLVILDTLARNFGAGDENSTQDMNRFVAAVDALRKATGAHVMAIHHTGKEASKGARGSSVLRAAVDTEIEIERTEGTPCVTFSVTKQKDAEEREPILFQMVKAEAVDPVSGEVLASVVPSIREANATPKILTPNALAILDALGSGGKTYKQLEEKTSIPGGTIKRIMQELARSGEVYASEDGQVKIWYPFTGEVNGKTDEKSNDCPF
jgi:hypothetical protein